MMNFSNPILYLLLSLLAILLSSFTVLLIFGKIEFFKMIIIGITMFINIYIVGACFLFTFDVFSVAKTLILTLILHILILVCVYCFCRKKGKKYSIKFNLKECIAIITIILFLFPMAYQRNGYFCMSQDEGAYFIKILYLIEGNNSNIQKLEEYDYISNDEYRDFFVNAMRTYSGGLFNPLNDLEYISSEKQKVDDYSMFEQGLYGRFHAIPTFPSVVALFGIIFGEYHIGYINFIFFFIYLILIYYIMKNLKIKMWLSVIMTFACGSVPITIWCQKSYLTEMYLAVLMMGMLFFLTEKKLILKILSVIYFGTICYYHVTAFVFVPLIILIFFFLFLSNKEKNYLVAILSVLIFYYVGFNLMLKIHPAYTVANYNGHLNFMNVWDVHRLWLLITILCGILFISFLGIFIKSRIQEKMWLVWKKYFQDKFGSIVIMTSFVLVLFNLKIILQMENWQQNCLVAYIFLSGIFLMPFSYFYWVRDREIFSSVENNYIIAFCYIYAVLLLSCFVKSILAYYYATRYLMPYIAFVFIFAAVVFNNNKSGYWLCVILCLLSIKYMFVYDSVVARYQDDTSYQIETLVRLRNVLKEDDIVIVGGVDHHEFGAWYALFRLGRVRTYPLMKDIKYTLESIDCAGERYLYICNEELISESDKWHLIDTLDNHLSMLKDYTNVYSDMLLNSISPEFYHNYSEKIFIYENDYGEK